MFCNIGPRGQCYKTFYICNLQILVKSYTDVKSFITLAPGIVWMNERPDDDVIQGGGAVEVVLQVVVAETSLEWRRRDI